MAANTLLKALHDAPAPDPNRTTYSLISADSHVNEPRDLWTERLAARYQERAPHVASFERGDGWIFEDVPNPLPLRRATSAGFGVWAGEGGPWMRWDETRPSSADPNFRLKEQDIDGVDAEVLYPDPVLYGCIVATHDADFQLALVRAYNDWLSEYCSHAPQRLFGMAQLPCRGVEGAVAELERAMELPGIRGAHVAQYPHGTSRIAPEDDALWGALQERNIPIAVHVSIGEHRTTGLPLDAPETLPGGEYRFGDAPNRIYEFIYTGVLKRFPDLRVVFAETDAGWVPCFKEQTFNRWRRQHPDLRAAVGMEIPPSHYWDRFSYTYITDSFAIRNRHDIGVAQLMWSSDFPHSAGDFPYSWRTIEADFGGIPHEERQLILAANCLRNYGIAA
jgi:predicted TIM-barrel fold metal-dependent hydrolase